MEPGPEGTPVPSEATVIRLGRPTSDGRMMDHHFELSTDDKATPTPRLSVWVEALTSVEQAHALTDGKYGIAGFVPVAQVRTIRPSPDDPVIQNLDVEWEPFRRKQADGTYLDAAAAGSTGHCGVTGLNQRTGKDAQGRRLDAYRKSLRRELAALANRTRVVEIPAHLPQ